MYVYIWFSLCCRHSNMDVKSYRYYDPVTCGMDLPGALDDIRVSHPLTLYPTHLPHIEPLLLSHLFIVSQFFQVHFCF